MHNLQIRGNPSFSKVIDSSQQGLERHVELQRWKKEHVQNTQMTFFQGCNDLNYIAERRL
jgi:hypothetical protein